ncbi:Peptidase incomplete domain containing protein [Pandoravirus macleodensis]|uniref:Peptidase incomplete domain containing protein n=1 Tax=Pandoravirus macleodensis TaxID=2107707 RepID=A0A2U7UF54_9VIRU|nr:Peptidase incomplete domain containing protein [Pandoravirus macleodensis]AVK77032.1 Peptidase incomplete domain containing protein [Pandoravirus macleodensis]UMO79712.1 Peptidase incomplete domain containing protein [Pandoravirus aubagnensis]
MQSWGHPHVAMARDTPTAAAEHASLGQIDALGALERRGIALPNHFDGRRKWRRLLARPCDSGAPGDECARALADRAAILSRGAVLVDLVAPHPDETGAHTRNQHEPPSLVALHRDQYVWGARERATEKDGQAAEVHLPSARRLKSLAYYTPAHRGDTATSTVDATCAEIYVGGPVTTSVAVHEDMAWPEVYPASWNGGIYGHRTDYATGPPQRLGAAVLTLVGWSTDTTSGRRYYLARGGPAGALAEDGVFRMWASQCGVEDNVVAALPDLWGARVPARFLHDAAPSDTSPGSAQRTRDLRAAMPLHPSGHTRAFVGTLPDTERFALRPLVDVAHLPHDHAAFIAGRARNPHEASGSHDAP